MDLYISEAMFEGTGGDTERKTDKSVAGESTMAAGETNVSF